MGYVKVFLTFAAKLKRRGCGGALHRNKNKKKICKKIW